jgi:hypothetical protein
MRRKNGSGQSKTTFVAAATLFWTFLGPIAVTCADDPKAGFEAQVKEYLRLFPYQETYGYLVKMTGGDPGNLNVWINPSRDLVKAGDDTIVRTNNDTFYKQAWVFLGKGPVVLRSNSPSKERFSSFQLQDDRNANYRNIIHPDGSYTLYHGEKPATVEGEAIEVPSLLSSVITRIEVKDKNDAADMKAARAVFDGIEIEGPTIGQLPKVDVLSGIDDRVVQEAERRMQKTKTSVSYRDMVAGPGQEPGKDVPYLYHATGTKEGWGGPDPSHSSYEAMFTDDKGETLDGSKGEYVLMTKAPPVKAFWSVTVYDTATGRLHPNKRDCYHINNTTAIQNENGTFTFRFKTSCKDGDQNCLEVPNGPFDVAARYYLPGPEIIKGKWTMPHPTKVETD